MKKRITETFDRLRKNGQRGFIVYLTAGDPGMDDTVEITLDLARAGVDLVELGVPFSDPLADGPVNQAAAERALAAGTTLDVVLDGVRRIRKESDMPIVLYSYLNPLLAQGFDATIERLAAAGVDGLLVLDLSAEEADPYQPSFARHGMDRICLVTPTSTDARIRRICRQAGGFLYCVSREGVTGARDALSDQAGDLLARARARTRLPLALGFGISSAEQVKEAGRQADAVIVGSALVERFHRAGRAGRAEVVAWAGELAAAAHDPGAR